MNRRKFLGILAAAPMIGVVAQTSSFVPQQPTIPTPKTFQELCKPEWDNLEIFTPEEIAKRWKYVAIPCFHENGQNYVVKTYKLKYKMSEIHLVDKWNDPQWKRLMQDEVKREVDRLSLTHIYTIMFPNCYIIHPHDGEKYYCAFVRGARVA